MSAPIYVPKVQLLIPNDPLVLIFSRALNHLAFRTHVALAVSRRFPSITGVARIRVYQATQAVCLIESSYAQGWKPPGNGSNNTGAVQCPGCGENCFEYTDTHPNVDGTSTKYRVCFKRYASLVEGIMDQMLYEYRLPETLDACIQGNLYGVSFGMHKSGYYEGFGKTKEERIAGHYGAMKRAVTNIAAGCGEAVQFFETVPGSSPGISPMANATSKDSGKTIAAMVTVFGLLRLLSK